MSSKGYILIIALSIFFAGCKDIDTVKDSVLEDYSESLTLGQALDTWTAQECLDTTWDSYTTDRGEKIVKFDCDLDVESIKTSSDKSVSDEESAKMLAVYEKAKNEASKAMKISHEAVYSPDAKVLTDKALEKVDASYEAEKKMAEINTRLAKKKLTDAKLGILFLISSDGKSFSPGGTGIIYTFEDGKNYFKDIHPAIALLKAYQNQKIEMKVDQKVYLNRK